MVNLLDGCIVVSETFDLVFFWCWQGLSGVFSRISLFGFAWDLLTVQSQGIQDAKAPGFVCGSPQQSVLSPRAQRTAVSFALCPNVGGAVEL